MAIDNDVREFLRVCPAGTTFTKGDVLELLERYDAIEEGSPGKIASVLGHSAKWWRAVAEDVGVSEGWAHQEESGRWALSLTGARAYIARKRQQRTGGKLRGPRKAKRAQTARPGAEGVLPRSMGRAGLATVGRRAYSGARPISSKLAAGGSEDFR